MFRRDASTECYTNERNIKAVLWNTSAELKDKVKQTDYFFKLYLKFLSYDGSLFRSEFYSRNKAATGFMADTGKTDEQSSDDDSCFEYDREQRLLHRTHPYYFEYNNSSVSATDVSLVTQLSADRLQLLDQLCDYWPGPISLALYMTDEELYEFLLYTMQTPVLASRRNIAYHIVYKDGKFYPVNYLRNVALRRVSTQYVFLLDIDFVPMPNIYSYLRLLLQTASSIASKLDIAEPSKMGIIVPAFESEQYKMRFPSTKQRVISMLDSGSLFTFKHNTFPEAQAATNYTKWRTSSEPYKVSWAPYFEPYVIVPRNIPEFNERFFGWGWNKALHMMELDAAGFTFVVSPDAFVIHRPHERSSSRLRIILTRTYRQCSNILKTDFYHYLTRKYGSRAQKYACVLNRTIEQWC